jgi:alanine racemase
MEFNLPPRPAWIEIDLEQLRKNFAAINEQRRPGLKIISVLKDNAYGHGAVEVARVAVKAGATLIALSTLDEAEKLRRGGSESPILLLGERAPDELEYCVAHEIACCVGSFETSIQLSRIAAGMGKIHSVHVEIDTGMSRFGVRWEQAMPLLQEVAGSKSLRLDGVMSHFAMSDERDKSFALLQLKRFREILDAMAQLGIAAPLRHICNSGGFLDLPEAHFDAVRLGLLPLGVYPSQVCRRIDGLLPVMSVKTRIAAIRNLEPGDSVGYGMRYTAHTPRRIAVLPMGYGDGFPRVRNDGSVLIRGHKAPVVGSVSMDAITVDITEIPAAQLWDEVTVMGRQGNFEISAHEIARLKNSVSYEVLANWRARLPRLYLNP